MSRGGLPPACVVEQPARIPESRRRATRNLVAEDISLV
jgi:hypothetical protein